jgi:rSAM/selenodomain-associated transferase 1
MDNSKKAISPGLFIVMKYPEVGKVKSRLASSIGEKSACNLYRACIQDTLATAKSLDIPFHIAVHPPESQERFVQWLGSSYSYFHQEGMNLGERLHNGFVTMFSKGYDNVIALASDCPDLPSKILKTAFTKLRTHSAVIGPAPDGGYYLIGLSLEDIIPDIFRNMKWSTDTVFQATLSILEAETERVHILPKWRDIDTKSDLRKFYEKHHSQSSKTLYTMKYLQRNPEILRILFS